MSKIEALVAIAAKLPGQEVDALVDFADFLYRKKDLDHGEIDGALLSEEALAQSWLSPEEEEAWKDL